MLRLRAPSAAEVLRFIEAQQGQPFSYPSVGGTRGETPAGYTVDHNRALLGRGDHAYGRAVEAIRAWRMFDLGWVELRRIVEPLRVGQTVAVVARWAGIAFLNACRVVYLVDEPDRFGFAYGTLPEHAESGEERFTVERLPDGAVWYDLLAFSRPNQVLAKLGYPISRSLQKRFARDSMAAMARAVGGCAR